MALEKSRWPLPRRYWVMVWEQNDGPSALIGKSKTSNLQKVAGLLGGSSLCILCALPGFRHHESALVSYFCLSLLW